MFHLQINKVNNNIYPKYFKIYFLMTNCMLQFFMITSIKGLNFLYLIMKKKKTFRSCFQNIFYSLMSNSF